MYEAKVLLTIGLLLLATTYALPEGYGVKGGRHHNSQANAGAFAQATANANGGCHGIAQSSATASANAVASGASSNAAASANAHADGGNIGKAISCADASGNANPRDDSDDLGLSNDREKDSWNKESNDREYVIPVEIHQDGKPDSDGKTESAAVAGQKQQDRRPGCGATAGVKGHRGASGCSPNKPSVSNPYPTHHENPDSSAGSSIPVVIDGGYGGNSPGSHPCGPGYAGCSPNRPSVSNPNPTHHENPDLSAGSSIPVVIDGGYGGNSPGSHPCGPGYAGCSPNKPSVSNPNPTHHENPDLSAGSSNPVPTDGGYGGNNPGSYYPGSKPCAPGSPGCSENKPSSLNPHKTYPNEADSSPESHHPGNNNYGKDEGNTGKPKETPCLPGDPRCLRGSKPKATTPDPSTVGIIESGPIPCPPGVTHCPKQEPGVSNPNPTYEDNPYLSGGSKYPTGFDGASGSKIPTAGSPKKPDTSNPFLNGEVNVSGIKNSGKPGQSSVIPDVQTNPLNPFLNPLNQGSQPTTTKRPENPNGSYGGHHAQPEHPHGGLPDNSESPKFGTNPSNPFLQHHGNGDSTSGPKNPGHSPNVGGHSTTNGDCNGKSSCSPTSGPKDDSELPKFETNPSNPFLSHHGNGDSTSGPKIPGHSPNVGGHPTANGDCNGKSSCSPNKSSGNPTTPFEHPHKIPGTPENKPNPLNPFLQHHGNVDSTSGPKKDSESPKFETNPSNPFLPDHGNVDSTSGPKNPGHSPNVEDHSTANDDCNGKSSCSPNKSSGNPNTPFEHPHKFPETPENKPNPPNPFLPHHSEKDKPTNSKYPDLKPPVLKNPGSFGESSYDLIDPHSHDKKNPGSNPNSSGFPGKEDTPNPFLPHHSEKDKPANSKYPDLKPPVLKNPGSFGESSYDLIDPHSHDKKNPGSNPNSSGFPGKEDAPNPLSGHETVHSPSNVQKPEVFHGCQGGFSSSNCDQKRPSGNDVQNSVTEGQVGGFPSTTENSGIKTRQPGVKGGSRRHGPSAQFPGTPGFGNTEFLPGTKGPAGTFDSAHANAHAEAHSNAHASSWSSSGVPGEHGSAKSEAYSEANPGNSGWSSAWATSSASASASAWGSSHSEQGSVHWEEPKIPAVPAQ